ncbi:THO complex subunit 1 [Lamellibrachia satsuma]|nr:THO complex subunit 1 [Lamellibrachia satsuma]
MAAPATFDFSFARKYFAECLQKTIEKRDLPELETGFHWVEGSDIEKKATLDQVFRDELTRLIVSQSQSTDTDTTTYRMFIETAVEAVKAELCAPSIPFHLMADLFDSITIDKCEDVFKFVEENVSVWKSEMFYNAGKNYLLRMCNDIVRRLSKSQNTIFSGRIQLFLATLFPLSEKSGLNLMSQFHLDNVTVYNTKSEEYDQARKLSVEEKDESMEEGEMDDLSGAIPIDYNLYHKFWQLQDYFRRPAQCYEKVAWKTFASFSDEVLSCFESYKLDDQKALKQRDLTPVQAQQQTYFAKYLTSEKASTQSLCTLYTLLKDWFSKTCSWRTSSGQQYLLDLQLSDSNFRRSVLVQFLILFQYLNAPVKFKNSSQVLVEDQAGWVKKTNDRVYSILRETPPDGATFAATTEHMLAREENWSVWKNDGCASYVREKVPAPSKTQAGRAKKRSLGEDLKASGGKLIKMGNSELTRLWNLCPDNMEACRSSNRNFLPPMEEFFEEAIEQADPEAMIEDTYKLVNKKGYAWKALRLLALRSAYFFAQQPSIGQPKPLAQYLEQMISKLAKDMPAHMEEGKGEGVMEGSEDQTPDGLEKDEAGSKEGHEEEGEDMSVVTDSQLMAIAERLGSKWKQLATELSYTEEDMAQFESPESDTTSALSMLSTWKTNDPGRTSVSDLRLALKEIGQTAIAASVFGDKEDM